LDQSRVGKFHLWILVERLHVGMRRRRIEVEILLLHVLAVIALVAGETEKTLLQNRVATIPQSERKAQPAFTVRDAEQAILAPTVGAAAGVIVGEVFPAGPALRIILAHRRPLPLA